ncbi:hypothetical protein EON67_07480 [archaeon]|nr:MAG: hypothetical protein EON67_07480 [archaeon]
MQPGFVRPHRIMYPPCGAPTFTHARARARARRLQSVPRARVGLDVPAVRCPCHELLYAPNGRVVAVRPVQCRAPVRCCVVLPRARTHALVRSAALLSPRRPPARAATLPPTCAHARIHKYAATCRVLEGEVAAVRLKYDAWRIALNTKNTASDISFKVQHEGACAVHASPPNNNACARAGALVSGDTAHTPMRHHLCAARVRACRDAKGAEQAGRDVQEADHGDTKH